jgi:hypothetical protein
MAKKGVTIDIVIDSIDLFKCFDLVEYTDLYSLMLRNYTNNKIIKKCWDMFLVQETFYTPMFFDYLNYIFLVMKDLTNSTSLISNLWKYSKTPVLAKELLKTPKFLN